MTLPAGMLDNNLPGSPSAIAALLQHLMTPPTAPPQGGPSVTPGAMPSPMGEGGLSGPGGPAGPGGPSTISIGGMTLPAPQAAPMPSVGSPKQAGGASMMDRIHDWLSNHTTGNAPAGYEGLLTPDEIKSARPSLLSSMIGTPDAPNPQDRYRSNLDNIVKMKMLATQAGEQSRIRDVRRSIEQHYPLPQNPTIDQIRNNLAQRYDAYIGAGDADMAKEIGASLRGIMTVPKEDAFKTAPPGSTIFDPKTGKVASTVPSADKANDFTQYVDPQGNVHVLKKDENPPPGWKTVPMTTTQVHVDAQASQYDTKRADQMVTRYESNIKPLRERAAVIDQALKTIDDAAHNPNPAVRKTLYTSAVANFIQAADQKAQIKYQLLNYFKQNVDPSIAGKWEVLKSRLMNGTLPQYSMEGMLQHLSNLRGLLQTEIDTQRAGLVKRHPELQLDDVLPQTSEYFPETNGMPNATPSGPSGASGSTGSGKMKTVIVNGKKFTIPE